MGHGDLLFHITVGGLGCRAPGGQPGRRAGHPGAPRSGRRTRLGRGGERRPMHILNRKSWSTIEMREAEIERARFLRGTSVYSIRFGVL